MNEDLGYGFEAINNNTTDVGTELVRRMDDGSVKVVISCRAIIQAKTNINININIIDQKEFELAKEIFQVKVDDFVRQVKEIAVEQGVPFINL